MTQTIINWYLQHKRDLPWRETQDPYHIWISEIILQQTRVAQGLDYYIRFISRFPYISDLAQADEDEVLRMWQGLGYYSRARNIHAAARDIMSRFDGQFPTTYKDIRSLKGIGPYTAAAIASFAYRLPHAAVDGNVYRVLSRLFDIDIPIDSTEGKKLFEALAEELLDKKHPDLFNQAMMEFGAMQCTPQSPDCNICPLNESCLALANNRVDMLPVKKGKTKTRPRYLHFFDVEFNGKLMLEQRTNDDIWKGLFQLPLIETKDESLVTEEAVSNLFKAIEIKSLTLMKEYKHILSHQHLYCKFYKLELISAQLEKEYICIDRTDLEKYAIPRIIEKYFENKE
ncbi:MAG: A/G-specific adenine glycosylase [Bacteroidales bacterium]